MSGWRIGHRPGGRPAVAALDRNPAPPGPNRSAAPAQEVSNPSDDVN
jgi:hypothetical protein